MAFYRELHSGWTLTTPGDTRSLGRVPATVPGCVHTDLLAAGLIADPYLDANEDVVAWIGRCDWRYETTFHWPASGPGADAADKPERVDLVCTGLDTVAQISVNGVVVGRTRNQHRSYRFDLRPAPRAGENALAVDFTSAYTYAEGVRDALGDLPGAYPQPYGFIRKMACNFGWDWGPNLVTAGIWRPIGLHAWSTGRLARVRPIASVEPDGTGRVIVHADIERSGAGADVPLLVTARLGGTVASTKVAEGESTAVVELVVSQPELWWPRGYGGQPLYDLTVTLGGPGADAPLDTWRRRIGLRSVSLDTTPDATGARFRIVLNGEPVFARGANWIPDDAFPSRLDRARYAVRLRQACAANLNLIRVWGGGIYESDDFYELCDELGLMVWQDFPFACAAYPEEEPVGAEVEAEAREAVARLMPHPSLVLWNGNNECIEGWFSWGWPEALDGRTWGRGYYLDVLARAVAETDPSRPYWPGSPYSGSIDLDPQLDGYGTKHIWDVWNRRDYTGYRDYVPRFAAEFGYQGPPTYATLRRSVSDRPLRSDSPGVLHHQKADDGHGKLARGLAYHFPPRESFDDWHYLTQVNQARAIQLGVEHFRSHWPVCAGTVVWQLNDCWPVTSWAAIDGDGRLKPLWYALRRAYAPRLVTVQPRGERAGGDARLVIVAVNDTPQPWQTAVSASRRGLDGILAAATAVPVLVAPRSVAEVELPGDLAASPDPSRELLVVAAEGAAQALWFYAEDRELAYPAARYETDVRTEGRTVLVDLTAHTLLRDVVLQADRLDPGAEVDDAMLTLLPGESVTLRVRTSRPVPPDALTRPPVLRCVNDTVHTA